MSASVTVRPTDDGRALVNPGMGWVLYFYSDFTSNYGSKLTPADTVEECPDAETPREKFPARAARCPQQFVGPPGSVRGTIYVGDVVY